MKILRSASVLALASLALAAQAVPIVYTATAIASGRLNGQSYTDALVTLRGLGDTMGATFNGSFGSFANPVAATVSVEGLGTDALTGSIFVFSFSGRSNPADAAAGFLDDSTGADILDTLSPAFAAYDLASSIGPVSGEAQYNTGRSFATAGGSFVISRTQATSTFTAQAVPEPASLAALGLGAVAMLRRRKRA